MATAQIAHLETDGETRAFKAHGKAVLGSAGGATFMKGTFEPGWRWSADVAPLAGSKSCQVRHLGYVISGRMHVQLDDGSEAEISAGDVFDLPSGHDAWVVGDEPCVMVDISPEVTRYATGGAPSPQAEDRHIALVRKGYEAFNNGDMDTLAGLFSQDIVQHVPGTSVLAGAHKGIDGVLTHYGHIAELTDGNFRADLIEAHSDGAGHVTAVHQLTGTRNGVTRVSRGSLLFTFVGSKVTDILELSGDIAGDDAFFA